MFWHAMPPELNTARLMAGAGASPMLQAAAGWEALAIMLETQADELAGSLAALTGAWSGTASERAVAATMPMVVWLRTTALQAQKRALQATAQATSYTTAMATTPPIPEIEQNHITHAVLEATNFFGINTVPIGVNEFDYFVRMWNQAAGAMDAYQAETGLNIMFEPILPMKPIVMPGVGEGAVGAALGQVAAQLPGAAVRNAAFAHVGAQATVESAGLQAGPRGAQANMAAQRAEGAGPEGRRYAQKRRAAGPADAAGHAAGHADGQPNGIHARASFPQQAGQMVSQPMQQLTQPLQQVTSMFSQMGGMGSGDKGGAQMGLIGASPLSNHPLAGGSGAGSGAGLVRAASLPGAGGNVAAHAADGEPDRQGTSRRCRRWRSRPARRRVRRAAGLAPVGAGAGGMGPMGMMGHGAKSGGSKQGLTAPAPLAQDLGEDEEDDW